MRKKAILVLMLCCSLILGGCSSIVDFPELSEDKEELITEYAAGLLLKYDTKYSAGNLLQDEELASEAAEEKSDREKERAYKKSAEEYLAKKEVAQADKNKQDQDSSTDDNSSGGAGAASSEQTIDNIAGFFGFDSFSVNYSGYEICSSYSDSSAMEVDATAGKQLLVLKFDVMNQGSETANFDMFYKNPGFSVSIDGGSRIKSQGTLMMDDMSSYVGEIQSGEMQPMVLLFEIDESATSVGSIVLTVRSDSDKGTIILQ